MEAKAAKHSSILGPVPNVNERDVIYIKPAGARISLVKMCDESGRTTTYDACVIEVA
jgi:hypothetical protein